MADTDDLLLNENAGAQSPGLLDVIEAAVSAQEKGEAPQKPIAAEPEAKAAPKPQAEAPAEGHQRDASGRFTAKQAEAPAPQTPQGDPKAAPVQAAQTTQQDPTKPPAPGQAPFSWSVAGKQAFAALPDAVKADIAKREEEVAQGFAVMAKYKPLDTYVEMAEKSGTTLHEALGRYTNFEQEMEKDFISGMAGVMRYMGLSPRVVVQEMARRLGMQVGAPQRGGAPADGGQPAPQPQQAQLPPELISTIQELKTGFDGMRQAQIAQHNKGVADEVSKFWRENPYAENLSAQMTLFLQNDKSADPIADKLKRAYESAGWLHPEVRKILIERDMQAVRGQSNGQKADALSKARQAAQATTGAPANGATPVAQPKRSKSALDAVQAAVDEQLGGM